MAILLPRRWTGARLPPASVSSSRSLHYVPSCYVTHRHDTFEEPYAGTIDITCAPADTPSLPTNSLVPSVAPTMNVIMTPTSVPTVAPVDTPTGDNDEGNQNSVDGNDIPMIIGSLVGAVAVLGLVGFVAYRKIKTRPPIPPPLPSYDDLVEGDGSVPKTAVGTGW